MLTSCPSHREARYRSAFTLIEVLVVVAIIALLISILLPSLAAARRQARATVCATNLRTIGQATLFYAQASTDEFPAGYRQNDNGSIYLDDKGRTELSGNTFEFLYTYVQKVSPRKATGGAGSTVSVPTYTCPEDRKQMTSQERYIPGFGKADFGLSYGVNTNLHYPDNHYGEWTAPARKVGSVKAPANIVSFNDAGDDQRNGAQGWVLADCMADFQIQQCFFEVRHKDGNQFLFLDGHVDFYQVHNVGKKKHYGTVTDPATGKTQSNAIDRENYGLPPFPSAWIPNWGPASPSYWLYDAQGHAAPITAADILGPNQPCGPVGGSGGC